MAKELLRSERDNIERGWAEGRPWTSRRLASGDQKAFREMCHQITLLDQDMILTKEEYMLNLEIWNTKVHKQLIRMNTLKDTMEEEWKQEQKRLVLEAEAQREAHVRDILNSEHHRAPQRICSKNGGRRKRVSKLRRIDAYHWRRIMGEVFPDLEGSS